MTSLMDGAKIRDAGETALVVEFGSHVDLSIHDKVMGLDVALGQALIDGVRESVPTYRSLMIHYDPLIIDREQLIAHLQGLEPMQWQEEAKAWRMPVCFDTELGDDLLQAAEILDCSPEFIESGILRSTFRVYMYGFAPGLSYLGGLVPELAIPRRATPRPLMPASSIIIAGGLAAIGSVPMPTGWYVVAATPATMFVTDRPGHVPFGVGDTLQFEAVGRAEFDALRARDRQGETVWRAAA